MTDTMSDMDRFWSKVDKSGECWVWTGAKARKYGQFWSDGRLVYAHRFIYEAEVGPIPDGFQVDHLCRNPSCVRPDHLEAVTQQENIRRSEAGKYLADKTHCPQSHPYSGENLYVRANGERVCRACRRDSQSRYRARRAA